MSATAATPAPATEETPFRRFVRSFCEDRVALFGLVLFCRTLHLVFQGSDQLCHFIIKSHIVFFHFSKLNITTRC